MEVPQAGELTGCLTKLETAGLYEHYRLRSLDISLTVEDVKSVVYEEDLLPFGCKFPNVKLCK